LGLTVQGFVPIGRAPTVYGKAAPPDIKRQGFQLFSSCNPSSCFRLFYVRAPEVSETSFVH